MTGVSLDDYVINNHLLRWERDRSEVTGNKIYDRQHFLCRDRSVSQSSPELSHLLAQQPVCTLFSSINGQLKCSRGFLHRSWQRARIVGESRLVYQNQKSFIRGVIRGNLRLTSLRLSVSSREENKGSTVGTVAHSELCSSFVSQIASLWRKCWSVCEVRVAAFKR